MLRHEYAVLDKITSTVSKCCLLEEIFFSFYVKSFRCFMCKGAVVLPTLRVMGVTGGEFVGSWGVGPSFGPGAKINRDCSNYHF